VTVSAVINPAGYAARVLAAVAVGRFVLVTSAPMLEELAVKLSLPRLRRRTGWSPEQAADTMAAMEELAEVVEVRGEVRLCRDPNDDMGIETALLGKADVLVSRDEDLTRVPEPAEALAAAPELRHSRIEMFSPRWLGGEPTTPANPSPSLVGIRSANPQPSP
jgi:putative PIN family toxin of toxin-antitoxin system